MSDKITDVLDAAYDSARERTIEQISKRLPNATVASILKWKFGAYGWTSPVNLFLTAAWYKHVVPSQDVCRIWAADHNKKPIPGGYAIRTNDEKYTVPLVTKVGIASGFCSPNSGMQGSRAIEKMRSAGRIERTASIDQAVSFDMTLFQTIMNDINDCNSDEAFDVLCLLIRVGLDIKEKRESALQQLATAASSTGKTVDDIVDFAQTISDPQFVRIIAAAMIEGFITSTSSTYELQGMQGSKTAADSQSKAAGDFWFEDPSTDDLIGVEVKDKTKQIGFEILQAIENRKSNNPTMTHYIAVSAAPIAVSETTIKDRHWKANISRLRNNWNVNVLCISFSELAALFVLTGGSVADLITKITAHIPSTLDLKAETIDKWKADFLAGSK